VGVVVEVFGGARAVGDAADGVGGHASGGVAPVALESGESVDVGVADVVEMGEEGRGGVDDGGEVFDG